MPFWLLSIYYRKVFTVIEEEDFILSEAEMRQYLNLWKLTLTEEDYSKHLSERINELKKAKVKLVRAQKQAENYTERLDALEKTVSTVNPQVREFDQELVKRLIYSIKVYKGLKVTIQFHSGMFISKETKGYILITWLK